MKMTKKFISVLLVCVLVLSSLAVSAFAWTGDGTQQFKFKLKADKNVVKAGDTVTLTAIANLDENSTFTGFGAFMFSFMFDNTILTPVSYEYGPTVGKFTMDRGYTVVTTALALNNVKAKCTEEEKAAWDVNGYNAMCRVQCAKDNATEYGAQGYWEMGKDEVLFKITFTVAEGVADGTPVRFDCLSGLLEMKYFYFQTIDTANGNKGTNQVAANLYDWSQAKSIVKVGTPSIINDGGSQIRFRGISSTGTIADYQGEFDVRTVAKISEADFAAKFTDEATAIDKITDIGFVYARTSKVADFNLETAKAVAQGTPAAGYTKKAISHIQHTAGNDYQFTCLVENIQDADKTDSLNALAYVCFNGEWIFADAEIFADFTELYGRMPK